MPNRQCTSVHVLFLRTQAAKQCNPFRYRYNRYAASTRASHWGWRRALSI